MVERVELEKPRKARTTPAGRRTFVAW